MNPEDLKYLLALNDGVDMGPLQTMGNEAALAGRYPASVQDQAVNPDGSKKVLGINIKQNPTAASEAKKLPKEEQPATPAMQFKNIITDKDIQDAKKTSNSTTEVSHDLGLKQNFAADLENPSFRYHKEQYDAAMQAAQEAKERAQLARETLNPQLDLSPLMALADYTNRGKTNWYSQYKRPENDVATLLKYQQEAAKAQKLPADILAKMATYKTTIDEGGKKVVGSTLTKLQALKKERGTELVEETPKPKAGESLYKVVKDQDKFTNAARDRLNDIAFVEKTLPDMFTNPVIAKNNITKFAKTSQGNGKLDNYTEKKFEQVDPSLLEIGRQIYDKNFNGEVINQHNFKLYAKAMQIIAQATREQLESEADSIAESVSGTTGHNKEAILSGIKGKMGINPKAAPKQQSNKSTEEAIPANETTMQKFERLKKADALGKAAK